MVERGIERGLLRVVLLASAVLVGCSQGRGDPCQVDRDCEEPYVCIKGRNAERGTCEPEDTVLDAGDDPDDEPDAAMDAGDPEQDAGGEDAATAADAAMDSAQVDPEDDAGS